MSIDKTKPMVERLPPEPEGREVIEVLLNTGVNPSEKEEINRWFVDFILHGPYKSKNERVQLLNRLREKFSGTMCFSVSGERYQILEVVPIPSEYVVESSLEDNNFPSLFEEARFFQLLVRPMEGGKTEYVSPALMSAEPIEE